MQIPDKKPAPFLVATIGYAGSVWLGASLHLHPDILCTAGSDHPLDSMNHWHNRDEVIRMRQAIKSTEDLRYGAQPRVRDWLSRGGLYGYCCDFKAEPHPDFTPLSGAPARDSANVSAFLFEELDTLLPIKPCKAYGNVHGVTPLGCTFELAKKSAAFNGRINEMVIMDLIRHPIPRLDTAVRSHRGPHINGMDDGMMIDFEGRIASSPKLKQKMEWLEGYYHVDFSDIQNKAFFWALYVMQWPLVWMREIQLMPEVPRLTFERIRTDREHFRDTVHALTRGTVVADDAYLDKVFSPENMYSSRVAGVVTKVRSSGDPIDVYEKWSDWQREEFSRIIKEHDMEAVYAPYGYDFSFLKDFPELSPKIGLIKEPTPSAIFSQPTKSRIIPIRAVKKILRLIRKALKKVNQVLGVMKKELKQ